MDANCQRDLQGPAGGLGLNKELIGVPGQQQCAQVIAVPHLMAVNRHIPDAGGRVFCDAQRGCQIAAAVFFVVHAGGEQAQIHLVPN